MSHKLNSSPLAMENGLGDDSDEMPISYNNPIFTFFVGKQRKPMTIHTALVAKQSTVLRHLVTGSMEEAQSGRVTWEDVDEDTFARFAQFVYTGDYSPASHHLCEPEIVEALDPEDITDVTPVDAPAVPEVEQDLDDNVVTLDDGGGTWGDWGVSKKKKSLKSENKKQKVRQLPSFHDRLYPLPACSTFLETRCKARANTSASEDYTSVFSGHARLYAFAETYDVEALRSIVLNKLHATLCVFTPYKARYGDVLELLRDAYENTRLRPQLDPLRELVTQYIAYEASQVINTEQCLSLVEDGGQLARDLFSMLLERLNV
ncbi:hypothetical protein MMC17_009400 [Xylographa soralifera]|nr:hypothetical protein [Xylographa soralifera]